MNYPSVAHPQFDNSEDALAQALASIQEMFRSATGDLPRFPPTLLYNEGWLLRLVLDWFANHSAHDHPLSFAAGARWFSEALLPSQFLARYRGDLLAENWTHADGVAGHFLIGEAAKADLRLLPEATQLLVLEAKMFSALSSGVTHASYYDQAARNVACMAEVLYRAEHPPAKMSSFGFYLLAPASQIKKGSISKLINRESIFEKVLRRVRAYEGDKDGWFDAWFRPAWETTIVQSLSWEEIIRFILEQDSSAGTSIDLFYQNCHLYGR